MNPDADRTTFTIATDASSAQPQGHSCACGESHGTGHPELDVQTIPHAIRHATLFGALDSLGPGQGVIFRATHDPVPLLRQLHERAPGAFEVDYLEAGPEQWRLQFVRL